MADSVITQHIQDCFVLLSITDTKFLAMARKCVKASYFSSTITEKCIGICYDYFDQFQEAPGDHFHDELEKLIREDDTDTKRLYLSYLLRVSEMEIPSKEYVMSRVNSFVKAREFAASAIEFVKLTEVGKFDAAEQLMLSTLRKGIKLQEVGIKYFDVLLPTYVDTDEGEELMNLGIGVFGDRVMLKRKQFVCILGGYKGKKSFFCVHLAATGLTTGLKVLYVTHELTGIEVEARFDMLFSGQVSKPRYSKVKVTRTNDLGEIYHTEIVTADDLSNTKRTMKARKTVKKFGGQLIIKKYPMGACTMGELNRYLDYLEVFERFVPDLIINDYADIMDLKDERREGINQAYIDHKRIADERNLIIITPSQTTREALERAVLSRKDFAEDIRKLANTDIVIAIAQNEMLAKENRMRVTVLAARSGEDRFGCLISQNIAIGQAVVDSWYEQQETEE